MSHPPRGVPKGVFKSAPREGVTFEWFNFWGSNNSALCDKKARNPKSHLRWGTHKRPPNTPGPNPPTHQGAHKCYVHLLPKPILPGLGPPFVQLVLLLGVALLLACLFLVDRCNLRFGLKKKLTHTPSMPRPTGRNAIPMKSSRECASSSITLNFITKCRSSEGRR